MSEQEAPPVVAEPIIVPKIYEPVTALIPKVIGSTAPVGKWQRNKDQDFNFRGIDDMMAALKPALAEHAVFWLPTVLERIESERRVGRDGSRTMYVVHLRVRFRFYGPAGDYVEAEGWGEGTDMGDKATNKAMTGAMKYVVSQVFAIADEAADADHRTPPESEPLPAGWSKVREMQAAHRRVAGRIQALPEEVVRDSFNAFKDEHGWPMASHLLDQLDAMAAEAEARHDPGRPFDEPAVQQPTAPEDPPSPPPAEPPEGVDPETGETVPAERGAR